MRNAIQLRNVFLLAVSLAVLGLGETPAASAQTTVGGHIGILVPWVTRAGGNTTTVFDTFSLGLPFGVSIKGQGRMFVDFEFIPHINQNPHLATLTVDPGVLWRLDHGVTVGLRAAFNVNSSSTGFVPIVTRAGSFTTRVASSRLSLARSMCRSPSTAPRVGLRRIQ